MATHEILMAGLALLVVALVLLWSAARRSDRAGRACMSCGYLVKGALHTRCPECGAPWNTVAAKENDFAQRRRSKIRLAVAKIVVLLVLTAYVFMFWTEQSGRTAGQGNWRPVSKVVISPPLTGQQALWLEGVATHWFSGTPDPKTTGKVDPTDLSITLRTDGAPTSGTLVLTRKTPEDPWRTEGGKTVTRTLLGDWLSTVCPSASEPNRTMQLDALETMVFTAWNSEEMDQYLDEARSRRMAWRSNSTKPLPVEPHFRSWTASYLEPPWNKLAGQIVTLALGVVLLIWILLRLFKELAETPAEHDPVQGQGVTGGPVL